MAAYCVLCLYQPLIIICPPYPTHLITSLLCLDSGEPQLSCVLFGKGVGRTLHPAAPSANGCKLVRTGDNLSLGNFLSPAQHRSRQSGKDGEEEGGWVNLWLMSLVGLSNDIISDSMRQLTLCTCSAPC